MPIHFSFHLVVSVDPRINAENFVVFLYFFCHLSSPSSSTNPFDAVMPSGDISSSISACSPQLETSGQFHKVLHDESQNRSREVLDYDSSDELQMSTIGWEYSDVIEIRLPSPLVSNSMGMEAFINANDRLGFHFPDSRILVVSDIGQGARRLHAITPFFFARRHVSASFYESNRDFVCPQQGMQVKRPSALTFDYSED
ncbi:hypothetical protein A0H81_04988 [Grifola frondosa]|uniref:Uncharacterized protein n=1 Tax=Grifola frondosa TaxID=5627 RepID=A0A1C7MEN7_GRIFR|nr:hypothetical protein A0H81_04988 [Grifola frondosa]